MTKLFVGNLSFKTREPDLAKFFETIGPVKSTNIIARGPRSLGYGFVEFEKPEDASRAVAELNKKELDGRPINVEIARPREPGFVAPARPPRRPRAPRAAAPAGGPAGPAPVAGAEPQRPPRRPRRPRAAAPLPAGQAPAAAAAPAGDRPPRRPRGPRRPRAQPAPGAEPSKTTLFVANLPFVVDDEGLLEIFEGMKVKEAHVVCRPNQRSKGYGFVTFDNEEDCRHALDAVDKSIVEGREITVRPAMAPFRKTDAPAAAAAAPAAAAPAAASPAAAAPAEAAKPADK